MTDSLTSCKSRSKACSEELKTGGRSVENNHKALKEFHPHLMPNASESMLVFEQDEQQMPAGPSAFGVLPRTPLQVLKTTYRHVPPSFATLGQESVWQP